MQIFPIYRITARPSRPFAEIRAILTFAFFVVNAASWEIIVSFDHVNTAVRREP
jgi:hypothetical protein